MKDPQANTRAIYVLAALIISLVVSLSLAARGSPVSKNKRWYAGLHLIFALLGIPAAKDLLQTSGLAFALANVAVIVLVLYAFFSILMLIDVVSAANADGKPQSTLAKYGYTWMIPVLVAGGIAVAGYMTFVEATEIPPLCGPVGHCGDVQNSPYAKLFGILPVGMLGLAGCLSILAAWMVQQFGPQALKKLSTLAIWGMCIFGVAFSTYLTFLEPFVIGATCMWCLTSAVLMILLLWTSTPAATQALSIVDAEEHDQGVE